MARRASGSQGGRALMAVVTAAAMMFLAAAEPAQAGEKKGRHKHWTGAIIGAVIVGFAAGYAASVGSAFDESDKDHTVEIVAVALAGAAAGGLAGYGVEAAFCNKADLALDLGREEVRRAIAERDARSAESVVLVAQLQLQPLPVPDMQGPGLR